MHKKIISKVHHLHRLVMKSFDRLVCHTTYDTHPSATLLFCKRFICEILYPSFICMYILHVLQSGAKARFFLRFFEKLKPKIYLILLRENQCVFHSVSQSRALEANAYENFPLDKILILEHTLAIPRYHLSRINRLTISFK